MNSKAGYSPVHLNELMSRCMNNADLAMKLLEKFEGSLEQYFTDLPEGWGIEHAGILQRDAHKLKGSAATVGANPIMEAEEALCVCAKAEDASQFAHRYQVVIDEVGAFLTWTQQNRASLREQLLNSV